MEAKTKKKVIIWTSVAAILGVGGYFLYKYLKDTGKIGKPKKDDTGQTETKTTTTQSTGTQGGGATISGVSSGATEANKALAIAYRIWANSTDALSKKYGKKSQYKLDKSTPIPYNSFFVKSYAAGKAEYDKSLATGGTKGGGSTLEEIAKIAARYGLNVKQSSKNGTYTSAKFGGKVNGVEKELNIEFASKLTNGKTAPKGQMSWRLYAWSVGQWGVPTTDLKIISRGLMSYDDGKFTGVTGAGVGVGAKALGGKYLSSTLEKLTSNQLDVTSYGELNNT